jgi:transcriptional regulator with GAF, ATPase, and Fis domain
VARDASTTDGFDEASDENGEKRSRSAGRSDRQDEPEQMLRAVVAAAVVLIPGADEGSISVVAARKRLHSEAASSEFASTIDKLQEKAGEGPCLDAVYEQRTVRVDDLSAEHRWPRFSADASAAGAVSMLALQVFVEGDNLGALNLYSRRARAFDEESEHIGELFASHAAAAYVAVRRNAQLLRAVTTREIIGQAQGILIERHKITADEAFIMLVAASQNANIKLRDVAETLVHTGAVPTTSTP